jgi:hypothetical protein
LAQVHPSRSPSFPSHARVSKKNFGDFFISFPIRSGPILIHAVSVLDLNNRVGLVVPTQKTVLEPKPNPSSDTDVRSSGPETESLAVGRPLGSIQQ